MEHIYLVVYYRFIVRLHLSLKFVVIVIHVFRDLLSFIFVFGLDLERNLAMLPYLHKKLTHH